MAREGSDSARQRATTRGLKETGTYSVSAASEPPEHPHFTNVPTSTRHNSTTMDPIQEAIEDTESRESRDEFSYREVAKKFDINRTTLSRRH